MEKVKNYIQLHLNILLFSLTSVFSKMASVQYNRHGLGSMALCVPGTDDRKLRNLCHCMAAGDKEVFPVHCVCQQECVPVVVADLGSGDLS